MAKTIAEQVGVMDEGDAALIAPLNGQQPPTDDRPEWLPENFKSPEELARAYDESRREMNRQQSRAEASERAVQELAQQMEDLRQQQQRIQQPQPEYNAAMDPYLLAEAQAWEEADYTRALQLRDVRTAQMIQAAQQMWGPSQQPDPGPNADPAMYASVVLQEMKNRYGDEWTPELANEVGDAVRPFLSEDTPFQETINRLTFVTDAIRHRKLAEQHQQQEGQQQQAAHAKRLAQTAPGGSGRLPGATNPADEWAQRLANTAQRPYWAQ